MCNLLEQSHVLQPRRDPRLARRPCDWHSEAINLAYAEPLPHGSSHLHRSENKEMSHSWARRHRSGMSTPPADKAARAWRTGKRCESINHVQGGSDGHLHMATAVAAIC